MRRRIRGRAASNAEDAIEKCVEEYKQSIDILRSALNFLADNIFADITEVSLNDYAAGDPDHIVDSQTFSNQEQLLEEVSRRSSKAVYPFVIVRPYFYQLTVSELKPRIKAYLNKEPNLIRRNRCTPTFYGTTITRPGEAPFSEYLKRELTFIEFGIEPFSYSTSNELENAINMSLRKPRPIYVGKSLEPIPLAFGLPGSEIIRMGEKAIQLKMKEMGSASSALDRNYLKDRLGSRWRRFVNEAFAKPQLSKIDDRIVDGLMSIGDMTSGKYRLYPSTFSEQKSEMESSKRKKILKLKGQDKADKKLAKTVSRIDSIKPLSFYRALRTDYSVMRLHHYTHTEHSNFQPAVLLTNYRLYSRAFFSTFINRVSLGHGTLVTGLFYYGVKPAMQYLQNLYKACVCV